MGGAAAVSVGGAHTVAASPAAECCRCNQASPPAAMPWQQWNTRMQAAESAASTHRRASAKMHSGLFSSSNTPAYLKPEARDHRVGFTARRNRVRVGLPRRPPRLPRPGGDLVLYFCAVCKHTYPKYRGFSMLASRRSWLLRLNFRFEGGHG